MEEPGRHCRERGHLRKASQGGAGGEALCELARWHCSVEKLCGGWGPRDPGGQIISWGCHAGSEGPQLHGCPTQSSFAMCYSLLVHAKFGEIIRNIGFPHGGGNRNGALLEQTWRQPFLTGRAVGKCFMNRLCCAHRWTPLALAT